MKFHSMMPLSFFNHGTTFSQTFTDQVLFATFPKMNNQDRVKIRSLIQTPGSVFNQFNVLKKFLAGKCLSWLRT